MGEAEFAEVAARLRSILEPYRATLSFVEGPAGVSAFLPGQEGTARGYVAGIRVGKRYVSFYLMPLYVWPALATDVSPELLRRKQGKACFNFKAVDKALLAELAEVTRRGIERFRAEGLPEGARPYV